MSNSAMPDMSLNSTAGRERLPQNGLDFRCRPVSLERVQDADCNQVSGAEAAIFADENGFFRCRQRNRPGSGTAATCCPRSRECAAAGSGRGARDEGAPANPAAGDPPCWRLAVRGVEAGEDLGTGTQLGLAEPVERRLDGVEE